MFLSSGVIFAQEIEFSRPDVLSQMLLLFEKATIPIPEVDLTENISLSDSTDVISNSIVFHVQSGNKLSPGYYYWNNDMWNPLINSLKGYELLLLWDSDSHEFSYSDIDGSVLTIGIGGIENAEFNLLKKDEKTLMYTALGGKELVIDFNEVIGTDEVIKTFVLKKNIISFYDNGLLRQINFKRAPKKKEMSVIPSKLHLVTVKPVRPEMFKGSENINSEESGATDNLTKEVAENSTVRKKVREGREIKSIEDNEDGTFTISYADGSRFTSLDLKNPKLDEKRELVNVINKGDGTFVALFSDGTSLSSKELYDVYNFEGYGEGDSPEVDVVIDNGDGTYDMILTNGMELRSINFAEITKPHGPEEDGRGILSVMNRDDGTFDVIFTDGTEVNSKDLSDLEKDDLSAFLPEESIENVEVEENENDELDSESIESIETGPKKEIRNIVKQEDGTSKIILTDGTVFSISNLNLKNEAADQPVDIEKLIENTDGTYTVVFADGMKLSSLDVYGLETDSNNEKIEAQEAVSVEERQKGSNETNKKAAKVEDESPAILKENRKEPNGKTDPVGGAEEYRERIIRIQREEIEALKKREEEKERELNEMNQRLKRLEKLFMESE